jgi:putative hydrolase of the HAD superfamily
MNIRCIVLDIDDTLYLERDYVLSGFQAVDRWVRARFGVEKFCESAWSAFEAGRRGDIFNYCLGEAGVEPTPDTLAEIVTVYRTHVPAITLTADARSFLNRSSLHARLAVVSDGPLESQNAKARALGLSQWAEPIVLTAAYGPDFHKPSPRPFELVSTRLESSPGDCCYVADNPLKDFSGPKSLGWQTIRVRRPGGLHFGRDRTADVDLEVATLDAVSFN